MTDKYNSREDYVSYEIGELLQISGFTGDWRKHYYGYNGRERAFLTDGLYNDEYDVPAPTLQVAVKWVYETYKVHIQPEIYYDEKGMSWLVKIFKVGPQKITLIQTILPNATKQEAIEKALNYVLVIGKRGKDYDAI